MKKYLFKCRECGHEFRLQAWKAVCPNCEKSYSLVKVVEPARSLRIRPRIFISILLLIYAAYSIITVNIEPSLPLTYFYLYQVFIIGGALFALSGSLPSNALSVFLGGLIAYSHIASLSTNYYSIIFIILGVIIAILGTLDELIIRHSRKEI
ncbi:MAG: hypothetical protein QXQ33_00395 [Nitrososphaerota archaeon]